MSTVDVSKNASKHRGAQKVPEWKKMRRFTNSYNKNNQMH